MLNNIVGVGVGVGVSGPESLPPQPAARQAASTAAIRALTKCDFWVAINFNLHKNPQKQISGIQGVLHKKNAGPLNQRKSRATRTPCSSTM